MATLIAQRDGHSRDQAASTLTVCFLTILLTLASCSHGLLRETASNDGETTAIANGDDERNDAVTVRLSRNRFWDSQSVITVNSSGTWAATSGQNGAVLLWRVEDGRHTHTLSHADRPILDAAFSRQADLIATSGSDGKIIVRSMDKAERVRTLEGHLGRAGIEAELQFTPDGGRLVSFGEDDWFLNVYDIETGEMLQHHAIRPSRMQLCENEDGTAYTPVTTFRIFTANVVFTPDCGEMILYIYDALYWFDVESGRELRHLELTEDYYYSAAQQSLAISDNGERLATIAYSGSGSSNEPRERLIELRDADSGDVQTTIRIQSDQPAVATFSPDGARLAVALGDDGLHVYETTKGDKLAQIEAGQAAIRASAFTPDAERLIVLYPDGTAEVLDWREFAVK